MHPHILGFIIAFIGISTAILLSYSIYRRIDDDRRLFKRRLTDSALYGQDSSQFNIYSIVDLNAKKRYLDLFLPQRGLLEKIELQLERSNLNLEPHNLFVGVLCTFFMIFLLSFMVGKYPLLISCGIGLIGGVGIPFAILKHLEKRKANAFIKLLPETLDIMTRGIKAGLSVNRAMGLVIDEAQDPIRSEFQRINDKLNVGQPLGKVLAEACERVNVEDFRFFAVAIFIQSETGGSLSEALLNLSSIVRKRQELRLKIKALSSEARASALIVGSLPFLAAIALFFLRPDHLQVFFTTASGKRVFLIACTMMVIGAYVIRRMIQFRI